MASVFPTTIPTTLLTHLFLLLCFNLCLFVRLSDSFFQMESKQSNALWSNISKQLVVDTSRRRKTTPLSSGNPLRPALQKISSSLPPENPLRASQRNEKDEITFHGRSRDEIKRLTSTPGAVEQLRRFHEQHQQQQQRQNQQLQHRRSFASREERKMNSRRHQRKRHRHNKAFNGLSENNNNKGAINHQRQTTPGKHSGAYASSLPFPYPDTRTKPAYDHTPAHPLYTDPRENQIYGQHEGGASSGEDLLSHASVVYNSHGRHNNGHHAQQAPSNNCCIRKIKFKNIGYDTYGRPVEVDVGECSRQCPYKKHAAPSHFSPFIPPSFVSESSAMKPRFLFNEGGDRGERYRRNVGERDTGLPAADSMAKDPNTCDAQSGCFPVRKKIERWHLLNGLVEAEVIDDCACAPPPDSCMRMPLIKIFHPNSPYERRVDVGKCGGTCINSNTRCNTIANTTVSIDTPNGARSIPVISQCGCTRSCYRASYKEVYYEAMYNKTSRQMERHVKEIDVGSCVGGCDGVKRQKCVLRDEKDPSICLMSLIKRQTSCIPTAYEKHEFLTPNMDLKTVVAIKNCGCK